MAKAVYCAILSPVPYVGWRCRLSEADFDCFYEEGATPAEAIAALRQSLIEMATYAESIGHRMPRPCAARNVVAIEELAADEIPVLIHMADPKPVRALSTEELGYPAPTPEEWEQWDQTT